MLQVLMQTVYFLHGMCIINKQKNLSKSADVDSFLSSISFPLIETKVH